MWGCVKMTKVYMSKAFCGGAKLEFSTALFKYFMTPASVIFSHPLERTISPLLLWCDILKFNSYFPNLPSWKTFFSPELYQMNARHATYFNIKVFVSLCIFSQSGKSLTINEEWVSLDVCVCVCSRIDCNLSCGDKNHKMMLLNMFKKLQISSPLGSTEKSVGK